MVWDNQMIDEIILFHLEPFAFGGVKKYLVSKIQVIIRPFDFIFMRPYLREKCAFTWLLARNFGEWTLKAIWGIFLSFRILECCSMKFHLCLYLWKFHWNQTFNNLRLLMPLERGLELRAFRVKVKDFLFGALFHIRGCHEFNIFKEALWQKTIFGSDTRFRPVRIEESSFRRQRLILE